MPGFVSVWYIKQKLWTLGLKDLDMICLMESAEECGCLHWDLGAVSVSLFYCLEERQ